MDPIQKNKLVLFGAGKIGRSFIGQLFGRGGYEVVFIDVNKLIIDELNRRGNYNVIIKSDEKEEILNVSKVRGVYASDENRVINEIATSGIMAVSVGVNGLKAVLPLMAKGLLQRYRIDNSFALDIIIAENLHNAGQYFYNHLKELLPHYYPVDRLVGLIETSIGKMVPIMQKKDAQEDILQIFAEPYNTLILDGKGFRNPIPRIQGLAIKDNMKAWVDRKLFIHNLGHSAAAYIGYLFNPRFNYIYEALKVKEIMNCVRAIMIQSSDVLLAKYSDEFTREDLNDHIDDLVKRFQNKALGDTIFRVGCDLMRKLGPDDRLAGTIKSAISLSLPYDKILFALVCATHFRALNEDGKMMKEDSEFVKLYSNGIDEVLSSVCGFDRIKNQLVFSEAEKIENHLRISGSGFIQLYR